MKKTYNINYEYLTCPTGDPFADVGGNVIKYLTEKNSELDILELIEYTAKIYVNKWEGKLHTFFLNSTITQPAFKGREMSETIKYFKSLLNETAANETGFCRITGQKTKLFEAGRKNSLMSGSGTFINFHHNFQPGIMLSKEMIIRMFFIPYGSIFVGDKITVIQSNDNKVNESFVNQNCKKHEKNDAVSLGILKSEYGLPANALFRFVDFLLAEHEDTEPNLSLTLYHFSNFGASPEINIYDLPSNVFQYYYTCNNINLKTDWQSFLFAHYTSSKYKGAKYNAATSAFELNKKDNVEQIVYNNYKTWRNTVLERLLNGKPLLRLFLAWGKKHKFNFSIVELYQKYIQNMKKETLDKIKELAVFLTDNNEDTIKKSIRALDGQKSAYELRRFLLKNIVAKNSKNYKSGNKDTIITMEELVYYLFPDDVSWKEIRDILLFAIYQELHGKNINIEVELTEDEVYNEI